MKLWTTGLLAVGLLTGGYQVADASLPPDSLFHLDHNWTDQHQKPRKLSEFKGRYTVVALIFTRCTMSCPVTVAHLRSLQRALPEKTKSKTDFVLVTLDPDNDTPAVLKEFAKTRKIENWTLLHGAADDIRELSVALALSYRKTGKGEFSHGRAITILDPQGRIIYQGQSTKEELKVMAAQPAS